jgi:two-component system sensor histidine kinase KdpD
MGELRRTRDKTGLTSDPDWLAAEVAQLSRAVGLLHQLIEVAAHDLRNPLHALNIAVTELDNPALGADERRPFAAAARRSLERLERILADVSDLGHLDVGALVLEQRPVDAGALLAQVRLEHEGAARDAGTPLDVRVRGPLGEVAIDLDRARQALGRLLENSFRYARGSGPVELCAERRSTMIALEISDRGPGFPAAMLPDPLDRLARTRHARGLGLPLAHALLCAMGATMTARNRDGAGVELSILLPLASG